MKPAATTSTRTGSLSGSRFASPKVGHVPVDAPDFVQLAMNSRPSTLALAIQDRGPAGPRPRPRAQ
jgi:hypothetical protein